MDELNPRPSIVDRVAGVLLALQCVLMAVITVIYGSYAALDQGGERFLWGATAVSAVFTAGMAAVTWGYWARRRFAHGAAFASQLLFGAGGVWLLGTMPWLGVALIASALTVAIAVMKRVSALPRAETMD